MKAYSPEKITCEFYKNAPKNITEVIFKILVDTGKRENIQKK